MRHGDLVVVGGRKGVALRVGRKELNEGLNASGPGLHVFAGYWYGTNPLSLSSYGKILTHDGIGKGGESAMVIGKVTAQSHFAVKAFHKV
jgi:hypothetical protein